MRRVLVMAGALALAGCQTDGGGESSAPIPSNYRQMIVDYAKTAYFDPYSLRDVGIAEPVPSFSITGPGHRVCVRANGKNRMGGYVGIKTTAFMIERGVVVRAIENDAGSPSACNSASYQPFPELEEGSKRATTSVR